MPLLEAQRRTRSEGDHEANPSARRVIPFLGPLSFLSDPCQDLQKQKPTPKSLVKNPRHRCILRSQLTCSYIFDDKTITFGPRRLTDPPQKSLGHRSKGLGDPCNTLRREPPISCKQVNHEQAPLQRKLCPVYPKNPSLVLLRCC